MLLEVRSNSWYNTSLRLVLIPVMFLIILPSNLFSAQKASLPGGQKSTKPVQFSLAQNYPNPFNPSTKIIYSIVQPSQVKLTVTNILGQVVETLVNDFKSAGTYEVIFDGENISSGLYIYKLETLSSVISKKMTLLK